MIRTKLLKNSLNPVFSSQRTVMSSAGYCFVCGANTTWEFVHIINDELAKTWSIDETIRESFSARESMFCPECKCSFRLRQLAECLTHLYGCQSLIDLVSDQKFNSMKVAEINSCGKLHDTLAAHPRLSYSEYGSKDKKIRSENLEKLTYEDESFDLVLTSDTLEHVPDIKKALREIRRTLKKGGKHVFTIPVIWSRPTNNRQNQEPSYHGAGEPDYLVFNELGFDVIDTIKECGFKVEVFKLNIVNLNDVAGVIVATRTGN